MFKYIARSQIWKSVFRHGYPKDHRSRSLAVLTNVFLHLHPVKARLSGSVDSVCDSWTDSLPLELSARVIYNGSLRAPTGGRSCTHYPGVASRAIACMIECAPEEDCL